MSDNIGKSKKTINYSTTYSKTLENKILLLLYEEGSLTMLEISRILGDKYWIGKKGWYKLKLHLMDMEKGGLIEERHFRKDAKSSSSVVDYSLEPSGWEKAKALLVLKK